MNEMQNIEYKNSEEVIEQIKSITIDCITSNEINKRLTFNFDHGIVQNDKKCSIEFIYGDIKTCILTFDFEGCELSIVY